MKKSELSTSQKHLETSTSCMVCKKVFTDSTLLKHVSHSVLCKNNYPDEEFKRLQAQSTKRREKTKQNYWDKTRDESFKQIEKDNDPELIETCKYCKKKFLDSSILRHLSHKKNIVCKNTYSEDEMDYMRGWAKERSTQCKKDFQERNRAYIAHQKASNYDPVLRRERYQKQKDMRDTLIETCKLCKKKFWHTSILRHIGQKKSCKEEYTKEQLEFLRGWARERKRLYEIDYREENKKIIAAKRSLRNKARTEDKAKKQAEENRKLHNDTIRFIFESQKLSHEKNARIENRMKFDGAKRNFLPAFQKFQTFKLSRKDSKTIEMLESRFQEVYDEFEREIDKVAVSSRKLDYDPKDNCVTKLWDLWGVLMNPNYQIRDEWHEVTLNTDLSLKQIAKRSKKKAMNGHISVFVKNVKAARISMPMRKKGCERKCWRECLQEKELGTINKSSANFQ